MPNYSYTKKQLQEAVDQSENLFQVLQYLNLNPYGRAYQSIKRAAQHFNVNISHLIRTRGKHNINPARLKEAVQTSNSVFGVMRTLGLPITTGSLHTRIKNMITDLKIDVSHFRGQGWSKNLKLGYKYPIEDYLNGRRNIGSHDLKNRLINEEFFDARCQACNLSQWLDSPIALELHHIDGNSDNHQLSNLQILCPNCHSMTENYRGRAARKK